MLKRTLAALAALLLTTACFEIDNTIRLEKNLSGTADFHLGVDFEPMVTLMAQFAKEMEGDDSPLTAEEIAKAKADFKKSSTSGDRKTSKEEIQKSLPEGVRLLAFKVDEREFGLVTDLSFAFDRLSDLVGVRLPSKDGGDPTTKNVVDTPFEGLEVVENGDTITIRTKPANPADKVKAEAENQSMGDAGVEELMKDAFAKMRVSYSITAPFEVVSHNATRKEGNTLIWVFDMETFEKVKDGDDLAVNVTYRR